MEKKEWCNVPLTPEAIERMNDVLELYARPCDAREPVICIDEKTKQLVEDVVPSRLPTPGREARVDYHYRRKGTANIFLSVEPKGGTRVTRVTKRKTSADFASFFVHALAQYPAAVKVHVVMDNYKTHLEGALRKHLGHSHPVFSKVVFHYTPKRGSWLNQAEIELGVMGAQCLDKRIGSMQVLDEEVSAWTNERNDARATITWTFTKEDAKRVFKIE
ncbi:MAG: IS630 family transposase [Candidatus Sigynarchaeota archaeon]